MEEVLNHIKNVITVKDHKQTIRYVVLLMAVNQLVVWACSAAFAQTTVKGTVSDVETGEPLLYTTITNLNTRKVTVSDAQGSFEIEATAGVDSLKISSIGFEEQVVSAKDHLNIKLKVSAIAVNQVVVSTNREQEMRTEAPIAISSINSAAIEDNKPTTIDQVLNQNPGINMVDLGQEQHTMSIRRPIDYGASYLYLEDGIPIRASGIFNHNALLEINMANVGRIEIIRGPVSSVYGSEAIGGAVNFISKRPSVRPTAGLSVQGNNIGYRRTDFYASNTLKNKLGIRVAGYYADQHNGTLAYSDFNKLALSLSAYYYVNEKTDLVWSNDLIDYQSDMSGSLDSTNFYSRSYGSNQTFTYRQADAYRTKLALNHYWSNNAKTTVTGYFRSNSVKQNPSYRISDDYIPWKGTGDPNLAHGQINDNSFNSYGMIAQHRQDFRWMGSNLIAGGSFDYSPNTYVANYISIYKDDNGLYQSFTERDSSLADYQAKIVNVAGYLQAKIEPVKNLKIIGALRFDHFSYRFDNHLDSTAFTAVLDGKNTFSRITPKVGLTYDLKNNRGIYANFSQGFVPPQVSTLYIGSKIPVLKPVYYNNYETGGWVSFAKERAKLEVSLYRMEGRNEIISVLQDDGSTLQQNAGKTTHQGIEYAINTIPHKDVKIRLSATNAMHKFSDYAEGGTDFSGKSMPQAPNWIANAQVTYKPSYFKGFRISLEWQHIDPYFMESRNLKTYEGYDTFNLRTGYEWNSFEVWANIMNATNELYATVVRASAWGQTYSVGNPRNFNVGIAYKFSGENGIFKPHSLRIFRRVRFLNINL